MSTIPPGTAKRLTTGQNRPMTRGNFQTGPTDFNRTIKDKSYYLGLLHTKISEINNEIYRMNNDITNITSDNSNYFSYHRKAEELNQEIEEYRGQLSDYNMTFERLNRGSSVSDIRNDCSNLKSHNDQEEKSLDLLFIEKGKKEEILNRYEKEISEEKNRIEEVLSSMSEPIKSRYEAVKLENERLKEKINSSQRQIEEYKSKIEQRIGMTNIKEEALNLLDKLNSIELKRDELIDETKNEDEMTQKYRELRKREVQIDEFLNNFEEMRKVEIDEIYSTRKSIVNLLELISKAVEKNSVEVNEKKIFSAESEIDFERLKNQVLRLVDDQNKFLQKQLLNPSNY